MTDPLHHLVREWATIDRDRDMRRLIDDLADDPLLAAADAHELVHRIRRAARRDPDLADEILLALIRLGETRPVAHRIVLQALLPGISGAARRIRLAVPPAIRPTVNAEILSLAGERIASFPGSGRTTRIAANITRDIFRDYHRNARRALREIDPDPEPLPPDRMPQPDDGPDPYAAVEARLDLVRLLRLARQTAIVTPQEVDLLVRTRIIEVDPDLEACRHGQTPDTFRHLRNRAQTRLAGYCRRTRYAG